jgi:hypothetical protein
MGFNSRLKGLKQIVFWPGICPDSWFDEPLLRRSHTGSVLQTVHMFYFIFASVIIYSSVCNEMDEKASSLTREAEGRVRPPF